MKVLYLSMKTHNTCLRRALDTLGTVRQVDWVANKGRINHILLGMRGWPDVTFLHVQKGGILIPSVVQQLGGIKFNWTGDVRFPIPQFYYDLAPYCITLFSNNTDAETLRKAGLDARFLNVGFDEKVFVPKGPAASAGEIVFMGNQYQDGRFPLTDLRNRMIAFLKKKYPKHFALYGNGPGAVKNNTKDWGSQAEVLRGSKIAINFSHFNYDRYSSDRMFRIMGSGAFCLTHRYKGLEKDFKEDAHVAAWDDLNELEGKIDYYLCREQERKKIAAAGCRLVHEKHTWFARMKELKQWIV